MCLRMHHAHATIILFANANILWGAIGLHSRLQECIRHTHLESEVIA